MLKVPCNAADSLQAMAQCRFPGVRKPESKPDPNRRWKALVCQTPERTRGPAPLRSVVSDKGSTNLFDVGTGSLADRLRFGSLTENGLSYKEKFIVRCYEVGINKTATVETIANLLQVCILSLMVFTSIRSWCIFICIHLVVVLFWAFLGAFHLLYWFSFTFFVYLDSAQI